MFIQMSKFKRVFFIAAILLTNFATMYNTIFQVINYNIYDAFPNETQAVNFFISAPFVVIMIVSFISPVIYSRTNRRTSILSASIIFTISALLFTHMTSINGLIAVNLICGAAAAYINVAAVSMIAEVFINDTLKAKLMGFYNSAMCAVGVIFSIVAGYLAKVNWIGAFNTYWSAVLMTVLILLFVPSLPPKSLKQSANDDISKSESAETKPEAIHSKVRLLQMGSRFWVLVFNFLMLNIVYFVPGFFLSLYIVEHALGDVTYAGIALSVDTLGGTIFSFLFGFVYKKLRSYTSILCFIVMAAAILGLYFFPHVITLMIFLTFMGGAYGSNMAYAYQESTKVVPKACVATALGIVIGTSYIGVFAATYITTGLMKLFHTERLTPILIVPVIAILIVAVLEYFSIKALASKVTMMADPDNV